MATESRPSHQLIVEGPDDVHVVAHVMKKLRPNWTGGPRDWGGGIEFASADGDYEALENFTLACKGSPPGRVGLVIDADDHTGKRVADRWSDLQTRIGPLVANIPSAPPQRGWVANTNDGLRVGVWIMPDNTRNGALEAFLTPFVPAGDQCWAFAQGVVAQAKARGAPYPPVQEPKARLHTWLAWRTEPGRPYGRAIKTGDLRPQTDPVAISFADWFELLFLAP